MDMAVQKQVDQHEHTFSSYVRIRNVVQKTCLRRWTIGKSGETGSGISVLPARHDDDDDDDKHSFTIDNVVRTIHEMQKTALFDRASKFGLSVLRVGIYQLQ